MYIPADSRSVRGMQGKACLGGALLSRLWSCDRGGVSVLESSFADDGFQYDRVVCADDAV